MTIKDLLVILAPTIAVIVSSVFGQVKRKAYFDHLHISLNSRLTELLKTAKLQAFAEGELKGTTETHVRITNDTKKKKVA